MNRKKTSFKIKVLIPVMAIFIGSVLIIALINYRQLSLAVKDKTNSKLEIFTDSIKKQIEHTAAILDITRQTLNEDHIALARVIERFLSTAYYNVSPEDLNHLAAPLDIIELNIADSNGILIVSNDPHLIGFDYKSGDVTSKYMALADGTLDRICEEPRLLITGDGLYSRTSYYVGIPRSDGGFIQIGFNADIAYLLQDVISVKATIQETKLGANGYGIVLSDGIIIICPDDTLTGMAAADEDWYKTLSTGGGYAWIDFMGERYYAGYRNTGRETIVGLVPERDYYRELNQVLRETILSLAFMAIIMAVVIYLVLSKRLSPVKDLVKGLRKIAGGDYSTQIEGNYCKEFGKIKDAVNEMSANLQISIAKRDEAEREVAKMFEFHRTFFDTAPIGLSVYDDTYKCIDCNDIIPAIYGVTKKYYIDHFFELSPKYQPDGSNSYERAHKNLKKVLAGNRLKLEWMHCSLNGDPIPCEVTMIRVRSGEKYICLAYVYDLRHIKKLEKKANEVYYDGLTGIHNRRYLDEELGRLIKLLSRSNGALCVMMVDIDFFKIYNDTYGHSAGDDCLKIVADTLVGSVTRNADFVARYGGEEFTIVLPNTDENGARMIAEKLLENMRNQKIPHSGSSIADYVTVSIGVVTGKVDHTHNNGDYIKRADEMLYKSKHEGRDRYTFAAL